MKKVTLCLVLIAFIVTGTAYSQISTGKFKKIDYIHVDSDQLSLFLDKSKEALKKTYQQLVEKGDLLGWELYYVEYPGGERSKYNFISIASASKLTDFEKLFSPINSRGFNPSSDDQSSASQVERSLIKSELWIVEDRLVDSTAALPAEYLQIDYMSVTPGKNSDYLMLEDELAKPIHIKRMEKDIMAGWEVYSLISPGGKSYGYNFATGNFYNSLADLEYSFDDEVISQNMGSNANIPELLNTVYSTRDHIKTELSRLVAYTD